MPAADASAAGIADPNVWALESFNLAREFVYAQPIGNAPGPYRVTVAYS
jgi:hypothetical protein